MQKYQAIFKRYEKKYILTYEQYISLRKRLAEYMQDDQYGKSTICNVYYDTPEYTLIRRSIEKPIYKEKFRIRSYNTANMEDDVFLEIKKKFDGVVYKRRVVMPLAEAMEYIKEENSNCDDSQIKKEIRWFFNYYKDLSPRMFISYERRALKAIDESGLRITFDSNVLYRTEQVNLSTGVFGTPILSQDKRIMEIKTSSAIPLWLCNILDELKIYPGSFSKYGTAYKKDTQQKLKEVI